MSYLFNGCIKLKEFDINFLTNNVKNMAFMFNGCTELTSLDVSNFITDNVEDMEAIYEDLMKAGVIDPAKVSKSALTNAASIAGLLLTTECVICDKPEPKTAAPAAPGMGGMGGMDMM